MPLLKATVVTASDGTATVYVPGTSGNGYSTDPGRLLGGPYTLESITYTKTDYEDTVDFTITENETGITLLDIDNVTASQTFYPRPSTHATDGTEVPNALDRIRLVDSQIKIVLAGGGDTKTGLFIFKLS